MNKKNQINRRDFLKLIGLGSAALITPAIVGYSALKGSEGAAPPNLFPYRDNPEVSRPPEEPYSPILLIVNDSKENPFSRYLAEILIAEGLSSFQAVNLADVKLITMLNYPLILLAEGDLDANQLEMLRSYVVDGGRLIVMRPTAELAQVFGVRLEEREIAEGYWWCEPGNLAGNGVSAEIMQFHGSADRFFAEDAEVVAWLAESPDSGATAYPAITHTMLGRGHAVLWAFDVARSVIYTRQGNPAWANQERDDRDGIRAQDMFVDWIDLDRIGIPQADEQMRLLSGIVVTLLSDLMPLPRIWYFPEGKYGMLIATGDSHQNPRGTIDTVLRAVEDAGGHMSIYYTPPSDSDWRRAVRRASWYADDVPVITKYVNRAEFPIPADVARWRKRGHEFSIHPYVEEGLEQGWREYWETFTGLGYGNSPLTVRTHRILWHGWVETARVQATYGIQMNLDFYHYGPAFRTKTGEWVYGHFNGSGLPLRFVDETGKIIDLFQQNTQLVDEHMIQMPWGMGGSNIGGEAAVEVSRRLLQSCLDGAPAAIGAQFHIDPFVYGGEIKPDVERWLPGTLKSANEYNLPIWSAEQWVAFTKERELAECSRLDWDEEGSRLYFDFSSGEGTSQAMTLIVPLVYKGKRLTEIRIDNLATEYDNIKLHASEWGAVSLTAGNHKVAALYAASL